MAIKHGKIHPFAKNGSSPSHLDPIKKFVTVGVCDALEGITLKPQACDVKGAKKHNGQQCVIAKAINRTYHPEAVAVGRSFAYVVVGGVAIRFQMTSPAKAVVEEFDTKGRARSVPVELSAVPKSLRFGKRVSSPETRKAGDRPATPERKKRMKKIGVRAIGGGITA